MERAADTATRPRDVFAADQDAALAGLELARADGCYHGFGAGDGIWLAISGAGQVLTGAAPDELDQEIRAHRQAMQ